MSGVQLVYLGFLIFILGMVCGKYLTEKNNKNKNIMSNGLTQVVAGAYIQYIDEVPFILLGLKPSGKWEFPGGKVENNESHQTALEREWIEELDTTIQCADRHFGHGRSGKNEVWFYEVNIMDIGETDEYIAKEHIEVKYFRLNEVDGLEMNKINRVMLNKLINKYL